MLTIDDIESVRELHVRLKMFTRKAEQGDTEMKDSEVQSDISLLRVACDALDGFSNVQEHRRAEGQVS